MSIEALWTINFENVNGYGGGVVIFESGRIFGGDTSFYWTGTYDVDRGQLEAKIKVKRHNGTLPSLLGMDAFELELAGPVGQKNMKLLGKVTDRPTGQSSDVLVVLLDWKEELP